MLSESDKRPADRAHGIAPYLFAGAVHLRHAKRVLGVEFVFEQLGGHVGHPAQVGPVLEDWRHAAQTRGSLRTDRGRRDAAL